MLWRNSEIVLVVWQKDKYGDFKKKFMIRFYCCTVHYGIYILFTHQQMQFLLNLESLNLHENTHNYRSYMFRSSTILKELVHSLAKVTLLLKHSVKLRRCILYGDVAACREMACVLFVV